MQVLINLGVWITCSERKYFKRSTAFKGWPRLFPSIICGSPQGVTVSQYQQAQCIVQVNVVCEVCVLASNHPLITPQYFPSPSISV